MFIENKNLSEELVRHISSSKEEPNFMLEKRLQAFSFFKRKEIPVWGPDLSDLDLSSLSYYRDPKIKETSDWNKLPDEVMKVYEDLGIPKAERDYLGGVGAQYDFGIVYHKIKESLSAQGVIFENMDTALKLYPDMVREYFMTSCVPADDHKFVSLHGSVWSGGTFIYVPKGVKVDLPLQAYFRMNEELSGQFEHTLIIADEGSSLTYIEGCSAPRYNSNSLHAGCVEIFVKKDASVKYISIENWSKNTYNLNTKKAVVEENGKIEWISGNFGSSVTMLYPCSVLKGVGSSSESFGIAIAGGKQTQDTGFKVIHLADNTKSIIKSKSISRSGGESIYRGLVYVASNLSGVSNFVACDGLILDDLSVSKTFPTIKNNSSSSDISHEAKVGPIAPENISFLKSRGFDDGESLRMIVGGFTNDLTRSLPLEYAIEFNKLLDLEMK